MSDLFSQLIFEAALFQEIEEGYKMGKKYNIEYKHSSSNGEGSSKCETLEDFSSIIYDIFIHIMDRQDMIIFGLNGVKNPIKQKPNQYLDGLILYKIRDEYIECLRNYKVERLFSLIKHYYCFSDNPSLTITEA